MSDLVDRNRQAANDYRGICGDLLNESADALEAKDKRIAELEQQQDTINSMSTHRLAQKVEKLQAEIERLREIERAAKFIAFHVVPDHIPGLVQRGHFQRFREMMLGNTEALSDE